MIQWQLAFNNNKYADLKRADFCPFIFLAKIRQIMTDINFDIGNSPPPKYYILTNGSTYFYKENDLF